MRTSNLTRYTCDRCGTNQIIADGDNTSLWHDIRRINASDTDAKYLLCDPCFKIWRPLQQRHDIEFSQFMTSAETPGEEKAE